MKKVICDICKKEADEAAKKTWASLKLSSIQLGDSVFEMDLCELCALTLTNIVGKWAEERRASVDGGGKKNNDE